VRGINTILKDARWNEGMFILITGKSVHELWLEYLSQLSSAKTIVSAETVMGSDGD
jgi:hypothetical protein